jgi:hypothetical protein
VRFIVVRGHTIFDSYHTSSSNSCSGRSEGDKNAFARALLVVVCIGRLRLKTFKLNLGGDPIRERVRGEGS